MPSAYGPIFVGYRFEQENVLITLKKAHIFIQCSKVKSSLFKAWLIKLMK